MCLENSPSTCSIVVVMASSHRKGPGLIPRRNQMYFPCCLGTSVYAHKMWMWMVLMAWVVMGVLLVMVVVAMVGMLVEVGCVVVVFESSGESFVVVVLEDFEVVLWCGWRMALWCWNERGTFCNVLV